METETFIEKKKGLIQKIKHLSTLLEVSEGYPQWEQYNTEMNVACCEMRDLMFPKISEEKRVMNKN